MLFLLLVQSENKAEKKKYRKKKELISKIEQSLARNTNTYPSCFCVTSITEFVSSLFFTLTSLTRSALGGRHITNSLCLKSNGSGWTKKLVLNISDIRRASSSSKFPWQRPSIYSCKRANRSWHRLL